jgi:hypothetical protein
MNVAGGEFEIQGRIVSIERKLLFQEWLATAAYLSYTTYTVG